MVACIHMIHHHTTKFSLLCTTIASLFFLLKTELFVWVIDQKYTIHPSIHLSSSTLSGTGSQWAAVWAETPRLPSPRTLPPALPGGSQGIPRPAKWHRHSSVSWVFLGVSSQQDMPGTPPKEGVPRASDTDARATSAGSSQCGGAAAPFRAPSGWQSSSPHL